jgi:hypothetical protein
MERLEQEGSDDDGNKNSIDDALRRAGGLAFDFMKCLVRERHRGRGGVASRLFAVKTTTGDVERVNLKIQTESHRSLGTVQVSAVQTAPRSSVTGRMDS